MWVKIDRYGRKIGTVLRGETDANLEQLRAGLAWFYREHERDVAPELRLIYGSAETEARAARRGLWRDAETPPPWVFRRPNKPSESVARRVESPATSDVIGNRASGIYHLPECRDYNLIAERNRVYFKTGAEAAAAGFRKAGNCP